MTGDRGLTRLRENGVVGAPHGLKSARQINCKALTATSEVAP